MTRQVEAMGHRRTWNSKLGASLPPLRSMRCDPPSVTLMRHQMSELVKQGQPNLVPPVLEKPRVELDPAFFQPGSSGS